jgi:hypothetical protein
MTSKDHAINSFRALWSGFAISVLLLPVIALGQCSDGSTTTVHHNGNVVRSGSNQVWSWAQSFVTGAYANTWSVFVSATTARNGSQTHSGQHSASGGAIATVMWYDSPSALGSGTYTEAEVHNFSNSCGGSEGPFYDNDTLTVNQPTISGFFSNNSFWNLGPNSSDPQATLGTSALIYQSVPLTFNSNCNAGDTCNDTPQWVPNIGGNQATLSSTSGTSVMLNKGSSQGTCSYDGTIRANIAGFSTVDYPFAVNSPGSIYLAQESTSAYSGGYLTVRYYYVGDVCQPSNGMTAIPLYETFSSGFTQQNGSNWPGPTASSWPISGCSDCWSGNYYFPDAIAQWGAGKSPAPTYSTPSAPYPNNTVYLTGAHQFFSGTTTSGGGWSVYNGTIRYYLDHGDNNP